MGEDALKDPPGPTSCSCSELHMKEMRTEEQIEKDLDDVKEEEVDVSRHPVNRLNVQGVRAAPSARCGCPPKTHYGFMIQGGEDEDMPEGLVADGYVCGVDMLKDPVYVETE